MSRIYQNFTEVWSVLAGGALTIALGGTFLAEALTRLATYDGSSTNGGWGCVTKAAALVYLVLIWTLPGWVFFSALWRLQAGPGQSGTRVVLEAGGASAVLSVAGILLAVIAVISGLAGIVDVTGRKGRAVR